MELNPPGPDQLKLVPPVGEFPIKTTEAVVQVTVPPAAVAPGCAIFCVTVDDAELVQPFAGLVTMTLYAPG